MTPGGFPFNDWAISVNDNLSKLDLFGINDITNGVRPFWIEAGGKTINWWCAPAGWRSRMSSSSLGRLQRSSRSTPQVPSGGASTPTAT